MGNLQLLVQLLRLGQALLLGSLLRNLAVVVRLRWARRGDMWCNLGLDGLDEASALLFAVIDGLVEEMPLLVTAAPAAGKRVTTTVESLPGW